MAVALPSLFTVKAASWDTQQRLPYNRQHTKPKKPPNPNKPKKPPNPTTLSPTTTTTAPILNLSASSNNTRDSSISALLSRKTLTSIQEKLEETYLGYETWLPIAPKVEKPRSIYNAALLAYIGDCIYELYARRYFLFPPLTIEEYNNRVMAIVRTEAQDAMLQKLLTENYLSEEERDVLRWGKNCGSVYTRRSRTKKRVGAAVYNSASSLETLVGYLYLTNTKRLEEIMLKLGFSCVT